MTKRILWLDNDIPYLRPYIKALEAKNYEVSVVSSLTEAERLAAGGPYDLILIDVMVPTQFEQEIEHYPNEETDFGHKTGLFFYKRIRDKLGAELPPIGVLTVRLDQGIRDEFIASGLNAESFMTKYNVREVRDFLRKIESLIASSKGLRAVSREEPKEGVV